MLDSILYERASLSSPLIKEKKTHMWFSWQVIEISQLMTCHAS